MDFSKPHHLYYGKFQTAVQEKLMMRFVASICLMLIFVLLTFMSFYLISSKCEAVSSDLRILTTKYEVLHERVQDLEERLQAQLDPSAAATINDGNYTIVRGKRSYDHVEENSTIQCNDRPLPKTGVQAVHFVSCDPFLYSKDPGVGILGPWTEYTENLSNLSSMGLRISDNGRSIEILCQGLYFIYSQVTYLQNRGFVGYRIRVMSKFVNANYTIDVCSAVGRNTKFGEVSCHSSVVRLLHSGDILYLQHDGDSEINMFHPYTYFGMVLLNTY